MINTQNKELKYFIYCRSSADDGRESCTEEQAGDLEVLTELEKLNVIQPPVVEIASAKSPGRSRFGLMLNQIKSGYANAILCASLDCLYQNREDEDRLLRMLLNGSLRKIKTLNHEYFTLSRKEKGGNDPLKEKEEWE